MASTIASLFGPSAEEIVYERQKEERDRQAQQYQTTLSGLRDTPGAATGYALGYQSGQGLGQALGGLFGQSQELEDPRIAKALQVRQAFEGFTAADLQDPNKLDAVAESLANQGNLEASFQVSNMAKNVRGAAKQTMSRTGVLFEYQGQLIRGGYNEYGQAVGIDQQGNQFTLPADAIEIKGGTAPTPNQFEMDIGKEFGDQLGLDDYETQVINAEAKVVQNMPGNQNIPYPTALRIAYLRQGTIDTTDNANLGLSRPVNEEAGESAYLQPDGKGGFVVVIADANRQILERGKTLTPDQAARRKRRNAPPKPKPVIRNTGGYGQGLAKEPTLPDLLTESDVLF